MISTLLSRLLTHDSEFVKQGDLYQQQVDTLFLQRWITTHVSDFCSALQTEVVMNDSEMKWQFTLFVSLNQTDIYLIHLLQENRSFGTQLQTKCFNKTDFFPAVLWWGSPYVTLFFNGIFSVSSLLENEIFKSSHLPFQPGVRLKDQLNLARLGPVPDTTWLWWRGAEKSEDRHGGRERERNDKWAVACASSALIMDSGWRHTWAPHRLLRDNGILWAADTQLKTEMKFENK